MGIVERARRIIHRATAPTHTRRFDAAGGGRRWEGGNVFGRTNSETLGAADLIRPRARHAVANNGWAANGVEAVTTGLVGAGINPTSQHPNRATRRALDAIFRKWVRRADADGRTDFHGLVAAAVRAMVVDGEALLLIVETSEGPKLRLLPSELLDSSKTANLPDGGYIVAGVEFGADGTRRAYWISPTKPTDEFATYAAPIRVDAADVIHLFAPIGAGQVRGISWLASVLLTLKDLDELTDALLVGQKVAAIVAGFVTDTNATGSLPFDGDQAGSILTSGLEPGTLKILPAGYDVKFLSPQQAQSSIDFAKLTLRQIAAGLGVPQYLLDGDMSSANYSSLRASLVAFRQRLERVQFNILVPTLLDPVWRRVVVAAAIRGEIDLGEDVEDALAVEWIMPAQPWVDPSKDADATQKLLDMGLTSRRRAAAELGWSVDELDAERAADAEREKALGLVAEKPAAPAKTEMVSQKDAQP